MLVYRPFMVHENPGRIAQRESVPFTRERSKVRSLVRPPVLKGFRALPDFSHSSVSHNGHLYVGLARDHFAEIFAVDSAHAHFSRRLKCQPADSMAG